MGSLTTALGSAITSLNAVQQGIAVAANNLANVDTPGYVRQVTQQSALVSGGVGQGVQIDAIVANIDKQLLKSIQTQTSELGLANSVAEYYDSAQRLFGQPNSENSLSTKIDSYFAAMQALSNNPETASLRLAAVNAANDLASGISNISRGLNQLRLDADRDINSAVNSVNSLIQDLANSNGEIIGFPEGSSGRLGVEQQRNLNLRKLSEYIDITSSVNKDGVLTVLTADGVSLLDSGSTYKISHTPAPSINNFINDLQMTAITVSAVQGDGSLSSLKVNLATAGKSSTVTTGLTGGTIKGLLDMRDVELPRMISQLDNLAYGLVEQINAISNNGSSFPPPSELSGTTATTSNTVVGFSGSVMIAVINQDGTPARSPYGDETNYRPLTLDLSTLDDGNGVGQPTIQAIIDEINNYFGPATARASVGNLRDIKLAAVSDSIADNGIGQFNLELDNISAEGSTIVINSITLIDPTDSSSTTTIPGANSYTIAAGDRERTSVPFSVDFGTDDNRTNYTVRIQVQVTDASGNISVADIDYNVGDNVTGIMNDRYSATATTNVSGTSQYFTAPTSQSYARASLVDANGVEVAPGQSGFLKITTTYGQDYGIAISQLDSEEVGLPSTASANITHRGFSQYFGLNNLYVAPTSVANSAINMTLRADIKADSSKLQVGKLSLSNQPIDTNSVLYTYGLGSGDNSLLIDYSSLSTRDVSFASAGTLSAIRTTLSSYSANIIGFVAAASVNKTHAKASEQLGMDGLTDLFQKSAGVNSDEELARIVELENNYRASVQIITVIQELFKTLANAF